MATDTIVRVDPKTLLVGPNVRKEITLPADFVASVKEHGVKIPIVAHETKDGLEVVDGQMRTLAALDAGLTEVPVYVRQLAAGADRLVDQLVVNRERTSLSRADTVAAVKQLSLDFKVPAAQIAKKVGIPAAEVKQVLAIVKSDSATAALSSENVSLELAAKIAEAGLTKSEAKSVVESRYNPEHALAEVIRDREKAAAIASFLVELKAAGVPVVARPTKGEYNSDEKNKHRYLKDLVEKDSRKGITPESHKSCAGHAAHVGVVGYNGKVALQYVCTDPAKFGHADRNREAPTPLTEAQKVERAENSAAAKVWPGIVEVRTAWIREQLLNRKTLPAGWEKPIAWVTLEQTGAGGSWNWGPDAAELLGTEKGYNTGGLVKWFDQNPTKTAHVLLAVALAQIELSVGVSTQFKGWRGRMVAEYLTLIQSWGYGLSETEQGIVDGSKNAAVAA